MPKFTREQVLQYYDILGIDKDEEGLIVPKDSINLEFITDLYDLNEFDRKLSYTYKPVSEAYGILSYMINDGFWYEGKERRNQAFNSAMEILDELTSLDVEIRNDEEKTIDRKNNLKAAVLNGLCSVGDIINFRLYEQNASFDSIYATISDMEKEDKENAFLGHDEDATPDSLKTLYYLVLYSKFKNNGSDFEIFESDDRLSLIKLRNIVKRNLREDVPLSTSSEREEYHDSKILRLSHYRNNKNNE